MLWPRGGSLAEVRRFLSTTRASTGGESKKKLRDQTVHSSDVDQTRFDGRNYGLVLTDDTVQTITKFPDSFGYKNAVDGVCAVALPNCTSVAADLVSGGDANTYIWADDKHLTPSMHARIGSQALTRALNNPF